MPGLPGPSAGVQRLPGERRQRAVGAGEGAAQERGLLAGAPAQPVCEVVELRVSVPNRPGVVADVALALGRASVNIVDMALYPAADNTTGSIALWIAGDDDAQEAEGLIAGLGFTVARP